MDINDTVTSGDGSLRATLVAFDPARGKGQIRVEELSQKRGWFYITVKFGAGGQNRIDYKTWDVNKTSLFEVSTSVRNDSVTGIEMTPVLSS